MPLVSTSIPNLINGVSQQPPALRLASQAEAVVNCMPSPVEGLKKRPPMNHIAKLYGHVAATYSQSGTTVTVTTSSAHGLTTGNVLSIYFTSGNGVDGTYTVTVTSTTAFTYTAAASATTSGNCNVAQGTKPFIHVVDRDGIIQYLVSILDGDLKVFDLAGNAQTINFPDGKTYLDVASTADPSAQFRTASVADYTFICNREKTVAMDAATSPTFGTKSMVFIKAANYSSTYTVNLNGTEKTYTTNPAGGKEISGSYSQSGTTVTVTANGHGLTNGETIRMTFPSGETDDVGDGVAGSYTVANAQTNTFTYTAAQSQSTSGDRCNVIHDPALSTVDIASDLATQLNSISGFTVTNTDYIIRITKNDGGDYTLSSSDTSTGEVTKAIKGLVNSLSDLPTTAEHGFIVKVQGTKATAFDDYYVKFEAQQGSGFGWGVWRETVAPGITYKFNATTMPHTLVRNAEGANPQFTFQKFNWSDRIAGDTTTAKEPTFVGSKINNIDLFRNRLVFLADENVILSAADNYDRFWPETVQTVVDSDPVDLSAGGTEINFLVSSVSFANTLLLFSRHGQFRMDSGLTVGSPLTPKTATITAITTFNMDTRVDPVAVGRNIYFPIPKGDFTGLREFFLPDASGSVPLSEETTASVPRFIPKNLNNLISSVSEEAIFAISKDQPKRIYAYKFFFEDDTKLQSAWSYWEAKGSKSILGASIVDSDMYVVVEYSDGVYLEHIILRPENIDTGTNIELLLDRKATEANCSTAVANPGGLGVQTTITLPYPMSETGTMVVVGRFDAANTINHGQVIYPITETLSGGSGGNGTMVVKGDLSSAKFYVGETYDMNYEFSTPYLKEEPTGGGMAVAAGPHLQLRTWTIVFDETSAFELKITPHGRSTNTYPYNGITVGQSPPLLGNIGTDTGSFRVPVLARNTDTKIELVSSSPLPCRFQSAEWEGWIHTRSQRM